MNIFYEIAERHSDNIRTIISANMRKDRFDDLHRRFRPTYVIVPALDTMTNLETLQYLAAYHVTSRLVSRLKWPNRINFAWKFQHRLPNMFFVYKTKDEFDKEFGWIYRHSSGEGLSVESLGRYRAFPDVVSAFESLSLSIRRYADIEKGRPLLYTEFDFIEAFLTVPYVGVPYTI